MDRSKLLNGLRRLGLVASIAYYIPRLVSRITAGHCKIFPIAFYVQPVRTERLLERRTESGITVDVLSPDSVPEASFGRPEGVIAERFAAGHTCIGVMRDSLLLGFMWISMDTVSERLVRCEFEPSPAGCAAWDYDFFIIPRHRLGRTFARLWDGASDYLNGRGVKATISWIELSNVDSVRAHLRLGARRVGCAVFITAWDIQVTLCSLPPYIHWSPPGGRAVRIRVDARAVLSE